MNTDGWTLGGDDARAGESGAIEADFQPGRERMAQCPWCRATVADEAAKCPECSAELNPVSTIYPRRKGQKPKAAPAASGGPRPGPAGGGSPKVESAPSPPAAEAAPAAGGFRGKLIRILGGQVGAAPAPAPDLPPAPALPAAPEAAPGAARRLEAPNPLAAGPAPAPPPAGRGPEPRRAEPSRARPSLDEEDDGRTIANIGVDLSRLRIPEHAHVIEIFDASGQWRTWGPIPLHGLNVGRSSNSAEFPALSSLGAKHMRFRYDGKDLVVEDLGSLNGVALRLGEPLELTDGQRFRIGNQVLEFRAADPLEAEPPLKADDGEEFCSEDVQPLGYLDVIGPGNRPGLRFPITKHDTTVIGRKGEKVAIALSAEDYSISSRHAQIRPDDGRLLMERS